MPVLDGSRLATPPTLDAEVNAKLDQVLAQPPVQIDYRELAFALLDARAEQAEGS